MKNILSFLFTPALFFKNISWKYEYKYIFLFILILYIFVLSDFILFAFDMRSSKFFGEIQENGFITTLFFSHYSFITLLYIFLPLLVFLLPIYFSIKSIKFIDFMIYVFFPIGIYTTLLLYGCYLKNTFVVVGALIMLGLSIIKSIHSFKKENTIDSENNQVIQKKKRDNTYFNLVILISVCVAMFIFFWLLIQGASGL